MRMSEYLNRHVSCILESEPFKKWPVERSAEDDLEDRILHYVFNTNGLELHCDSNDIICAIFLHSEDYNGFDESLLEIPFSLKREQVLEHFGTPSKSGIQIVDSILEECGAWDRFVRPGLVVHVEYRVDTDEINKITLIRSDVVP